MLPRSFPLVVFATALTVPLAAQTEVVSGERGRQLDAYVTSWTARGFAGAVLAALDGGIILSKGYGLADIEHGRPNTTSTVFDMGSIVKDFTLVAVLDLEARGQLHTDDRLADILPGVPPDKADITIDQIIRMRAGFHEYHDETGDFQSMSRAEALERILAQPLLFEPGTDVSYSNSGYTLLAAIVERVSGEPFADYVRARLFQPARMNSTAFYGSRVVPQDRVAIGYGAADGPGEYNAPPYWPAVTWALAGSGGVYGSLRDLYRWWEALLQGRVLQGPALAKYNAYHNTTAPSGIRGMAGGNDFGFVFVLVELIDEHGLLLFAQNNNPTGEEDPDFVQGLIDRLRG